MSMTKRMKQILKMNGNNSVDFIEILSNILLIYLESSSVDSDIPMGEARI